MKIKRMESKSGGLEKILGLNHYMFRLSFLAVVLISFTLNCFSAEEPGKCVIKLAGKTVSPETHAILIPEQATPPEVHAAEELQYHLKLLTGQTIPVTKDDKNTALNFFIVGRCGILEKLKVQVDWNTLGKEGILIKTAGPHLVLAGGQRGALYACYVFIEEYLGVRWFARDCMKFPKEGTFDLSSIEKQYVPPFEYRRVYSYAALDTAWAARNRLNLNFSIEPKFGGNIVYAGPFVHSFNFFVPPAKYFKEHPEYFSEVTGKRQPTQLCLSNPDVERIVTEGVRNLLRKSPSANIVSVSQNDTLADYCQCEKCKAIDIEEGSVPSGSILRFVNKIAEQIEKEYPDVAVDTIAYNYSYKPPKITKPRPNVIVRLAPFLSYSQPLETGTQNVAFRQDMEGWGKICKRLYVWDYVTNFSHYLRPHPNLRVLKPNIQFFAKNGVKGIFEQGNASSPGGEFDELRTYVLAKLLWNPETDDGKLIDEFLNGYYGDAAPYIRQYIDMIHDSIKKTNTYLSIYGDAYAPFMSTEIIAKSDSLFDQAEDTVRNNPVLAKRVRVARLPLLYMHIAGSRSWQLDNGKLLLNSASYGSNIEKFEETVCEAKITHIKENPPLIEEWLTAIKSGISGFTVKTLCNSVMQIDVLPEFGGRIWRMKYLPANKDIINFYKDKNGFQFDCGGYEEYSTNEYRSKGWNEKYEIIESDNTKLVLMAKLKNGFQMKRTYTLDPEKPILNITSVLTNISGKNCLSVFRIHPVFLVDDVRQACINIKMKNGTWQQFSPANVPPSQKELWLKDEKLPDCEWMLIDGKSNIGVINRFHPGDISKCYLNWDYWWGKSINMELWSSEADLKPGESLSIRHSYEIVGDAKKFLDVSTMPQ